jgi:hypothetical protein
LVIPVTGVTARWIGQRFQHPHPSIPFRHPDPGIAIPVPATRQEPVLPDSSFKNLYKNSVLKCGVPEVRNMS